MKKERIIQIGIRVKNLDETAKEWQKFLGVEPVIGVADGYEITKATYKGKPAYGLIKQALFDLENVQIELIAPLDDEINGWSEGMDKVGEGLHHLAFKTDDMEGTIAELKEKGFDLIQHGYWAGETPGSYAYIDTKDSLKTIVELLAF